MQAVEIEIEGKIDIVKEDGKEGKRDYLVVNARGTRFELSRRAATRSNVLTAMLSAPSEIKTDRSTSDIDNLINYLCGFECQFTQALEDLKEEYQVDTDMFEQDVKLAVSTASLRRLCFDGIYWDVFELPWKEKYQSSEKYHDHVIKGVISKFKDRYDCSRILRGSYSSHTYRGSSVRFCKIEDIKNMLFQLMDSQHCCLCICRQAAIHNIPIYFDDGILRLATQQIPNIDMQHFRIIIHQNSKSILFEFDPPNP
jgi:hypothetical protein